MNASTSKALTYAGTIATLSIVAAVGGWVAGAESEHKRAKSADQVHEEAIGALKNYVDQLERREADATARREQKEATQRENCLEGLISKSWCLKQGYEVPSE